MSFHVTGKVSSSASIDWIIPDMVLMNEINLIDGRGETGKSAVVSAIIGGWNADQKFKADKRLKNVLWLSQEEPFDLIVKPRLMQYGLRDDQVKTIPYRGGDCARPLLPANHFPVVELIEKNNINCVVVDPFTEFKESDWSVNDGDAMRNYMTALTKVCALCHVTMFCMRHMRKASGNYSADDGMGSMQIGATVRNTLRVDRTEERQRRYFITVQKSNMAKPTMPLEFGFEILDGHFGRVKFLGHKDMTIDEIKKLSEAKAKKMKLDDAKTLLLEALKDGHKPATSLIEEADNNGIGERTLSEAKAELDVWSCRTRDESTNKMYFAWGLKDTPKPSKGKSENMPQLTLEDLKAEPDAKPLAERLEITEAAGKAELEAAIPDQAAKVKKLSKPKLSKPKSAPKKPKSPPSK